MRTLLSLLGVHNCNQPNRANKYCRIATYPLLRGLQKCNPTYEGNRLRQKNPRHPHTGYKNGSRPLDGRIRRLYGELIYVYKKRKPKPLRLDLRFFDYKASLVLMDAMGLKTMHILFIYIAVLCRYAYNEFSRG